MLPPGATGFPLETGTPLWVLIVSLPDASGQGSVAAVVAGTVKLAFIELAHVVRIFAGSLDWRNSFPVAAFSVSLAHNI